MMSERDEILEIVKGQWLSMSGETKEGAEVGRKGCCATTTAPRTIALR